MFFVFFVLLSDSKQNGDANVTLSEEEGCSLTQPLSPSDRWTVRCSRNRDKTMKEATCFLLNSGDFSCGPDPTIHTGKGELWSYLTANCHNLLIRINYSRAPYNKCRYSVN